MCWGCTIFCRIGSGCVGIAGLITKFRSCERFLDGSQNTIGIKNIGNTEFQIGIALNYGDNFNIEGVIKIGGAGNR